MNHYQCHPSWQQTTSGWQPLNLLQQQISRGSVRVGDAEREAAAQALGEHYASGRLDRAEYDERLELAFAARTGNDLSGLFRDLPQARPASPYRRPAGRGRIPFFPVLLMLIGLAIVFHAAWIVWVGLGGMLLVKKFEWDRRHRARSRTAWS